MSFLLQPFYYAFSKRYFETLQTNKINIQLFEEEPIVMIDINFDNINIIEDYVSNNLLVVSNQIIKKVASDKSFLSEIECILSFNNEKYVMDDSYRD